MNNIQQTWYNTLLHTVLCFRGVSVELDDLIVQFIDEFEKKLIDPSYGTGRMQDTYFAWRYHPLMNCIVGAVNELQCMYSELKLGTRIRLTTNNEKDQNNNIDAYIDDVDGVQIKSAILEHQFVNFYPFNWFHINKYDPNYKWMIPKTLYDGTTEYIDYLQKNWQVFKRYALATPFQYLVLIDRKNGNGIRIDKTQFFLKVDEVVNTDLNIITDMFINWESDPKHDPVWPININIINDVILSDKSSLVYDTLNTNIITKIKKIQELPMRHPLKY